MAATKKDRIEFRLESEHKQLIETAANLVGSSSITAFALQELIKRAKEIIEEHEQRVLSEKDSELFMKLISEDIEPNTNLQKGFRKYQRSNA